MGKQKYKIVLQLLDEVLMEIGKCIWAFDREQEKLRAEEKKQQHEKRVESHAGRGNVLTVSGENINPKNTGPGFGKSVEMLLAEAEYIRARKKAEKEAGKEVRGELSAGAEKNSNFIAIKL